MRTSFLFDFKHWLPIKADTMKSQIVGLHYLRAIATILVVVSHAFLNTGIANPNWQSPIGNFFLGGGGEIDFFFVMSGFIMYHTTIDRQTKLPRISCASFLKRRFIRIIPLLWVAVAFYDLAHLLRFGDVDIVTSIKTLLFWPIGWPVPTVAWTIKYEVLYYVLFGVAVLQSARMLPLLALWFIAPLIRVAITGSFSDEDSVLGFLTNSVNLDFGIGFVLAITFDKWGAGMSAKYPLLILIAANILIRAYVKYFQLELGSVSMVVLLAPLTAVTTIYAIKCRPVVVSNLFRILGDASYSIFLFHPPIVALTIFAVNRLFHSIPGMLAALICIVSAVVFGCLIHVWIEKPLTNYVTNTVDMLLRRKKAA